jgi:galactonate dehydratase
MGAMKITELEILKVPPSWVWLKVHTDEGLYGLGEPYLENHPDSVIAEVRRLEGLLLGEDPRRTELLWKRMYEGMYYYKGGPVTMSAISGIDQALWDLKGKIAGLPVYELLGGACRDRIMLYSGASPRGRERFIEPGETNSTTYASLTPGPPKGLPEGEPDEWASAARERVEKYGFRCMKFHFPLGDDLPVVRQVDRVAAIIGAIRDTVGWEVEIAADLHHLNPSVAFQMVDALLPYRLLFIEDAQPIERIGVLAEIVRRSRIPMAAGQSWMGKWAFHDALHAGLAVVQPDLCHAGGITECKKIAGMAEAAYAKVAMHTPNSIVQLAASICLHASLPNFLVQEYNGVNAWYEDGTLMFGKGYITDPFVLGEDGCVPISTKPGLGIELDEDGMREIMRKPWRAGRA